jgi:hypothetical protein
MNTYIFAYCIEGNNYLKTIVANSYANAIEKVCGKLEAFNDDLDLYGLTDWDDVVAECENYAIYLTDLKEID